MDVPALATRARRRTAIAIAVALVAGTLAVVSQPAVAAVEYGGISLIDSTGEIISGATVVLNAPTGGSLFGASDHTGVLRVADGFDSAGAFNVPLPATLSVTVFNAAAGIDRLYSWNGSELQLNLFVATELLTFSRDSTTILPLQVPLDLPSGAIEGTITTDPVIPESERDIIVGSLSLTTLEGAQGANIQNLRFTDSGSFDYRFSGLVDGSYRATFELNGSTASIPFGFSKTWYPASTTLEGATIITVAGGAVVSDIDVVLPALAELTGELLRETSTGAIEPVRAGAGSIPQPAVAVYPVDSFATADDAVVALTFSSGPAADGSYRVTVPVGSYQVAFGMLTTSTGAFVPFQYFDSAGSPDDAETVVLSALGRDGVDGLYPGFSDVPGANQFINEITWLAARGISTGYVDGTFRPLNSVNRDAMAAFLYRSAGEPSFTPPSVSPFSDVRPSTQFYKEITWLASIGVSTGYPDGTFRPLAPVARDAMAAFLYRFAGEPSFTPPSSSPFSDVPPSNQFYDEITWLADQGVSTGFPDGTFRPLNPVARDAMAAFLFRYSSLIF